MKIKIAAAQYPITAHHSINEWIAHTQKWIQKAVEQGAGLLLFPEYGSMELVSIFPAEIQKNIQQQVIEMQVFLEIFCTTYKTAAEAHNVYIVAPSFPVREQEKTYNRTFVFGPDGYMGYQDKLFMTRFENEEWNVTSGNPRLCLFETKWGTFGIQTCYDSEFSIGSHILARNGADLILIPSCTETIRGAARVHIGARARALETQSYTVVAQTVGNAEWSPAVDINYGYAGFYTTPDLYMPEEGIEKIKTPQEEGWLVHELDMSLIGEVRRNGQVFNYKDHLSLTYHFSDNESLEIIRKDIKKEIVQESIL